MATNFSENCIKYIVKTVVLLLTSSDSTFQIAMYFAITTDCTQASKQGLWHNSE